jgi:hypothetical protein
MINRSLSWMLVALGVGAFHSNRAAAQGDLPAGVTTCAFSALARSDEPEGPAIRDAPRNDGLVLGRLPAIKDEHTGFYGAADELSEFQVIGFKDGWFLIEGRPIRNPIGRNSIPAAAGSRANSSRRICSATP